MRDGDSVNRPSGRSRDVPGSEAEVPVVGPTPDRARKYVPPRAVPAASDYKTLEMETVRLAPEIDPRRMPTEPSLARVSRLGGSKHASLRPVALGASGSDQPAATASQESGSVRARWLWLVGALLAVGMVLVGVFTFSRVSKSADPAGPPQLRAPSVVRSHAADLAAGKQEGARKSAAGAKPAAAAAKPTAGAKPATGAKPTAAAQPTGEATQTAQAKRVAARPTNRAKRAAPEQPARAKPTAQTKPTAAAQQRGGPETKPRVAGSSPPPVPAKRRPRSLF